NNGVPPELALAARRQLAVALAWQADPAKYEEALTLLHADDKAPPKSPDDAMALAQVLATRPAQRPQAIQLLEQYRKKGTLPVEGGFALAKWQREEGQSAKAAALLQELMQADGESPAYLAEYVRCLLAQENLAEAQAQLQRLQQIAPAHPEVAGQML